MEANQHWSIKKSEEIKKQMETNENKNSPKFLDFEHQKCPKREVYSNIGLPQEMRKILNNLTILQKELE